MTAIVCHGDARALQLPVDSVDLICTSPPYFGLRDYGYAGQIGSEATPAEFVAALVECTREMVRVLKPAGSIFVNLGDKYGPNKSLLDLPWRYSIACQDELGLIKRAEIIWEKANGLPESVGDRVRRSHEVFLHLTKAPRYFSAVDEIREPHARTWGSAPNGGLTYRAMKAPGEKDANLATCSPNPPREAPRVRVVGRDAAAHGPGRTGRRPLRGVPDGVAAPAHHGVVPPRGVLGVRRGTAAGGDQERAVQPAPEPVRSDGAAGAARRITRERHKPRVAARHDDHRLRLRLPRHLRTIDPGRVSRSIRWDGNHGPGRRRYPGQEKRLTQINAAIDLLLEARLLLGEAEVLAVFDVRDLRDLRDLFGALPAFGQDGRVVSS